MNRERRIRELLMRLPAVEETLRPRSGKMLYWVPAKALGGATFAVLDPDGGDDAGRPFLSFRARPERYASLIAEHDLTPAPYAARFSWVAVTSRSSPSAETLDALVRDAYAYTLERLPKRVRGLTEARIR